MRIAFTVWSLHGPAMEGLMLNLSPYAAFNVFMRKRNPSLCCAVRQDQPIPVFIESGTWDFGGTVSPEEPSLGFQPELASEATKAMGYYLFKAPDAGPSLSAAA
jgi:hypothetical protein